MATGEPDWVPPGVDTNRANVARVYDYLVGGTHNFLADQDVGRAIIAVEPNARAIFAANRAFLGRAVRFLAAAGIRQFIDIGSGIPTESNVHEVAQQAAPDARVVYADIDPVAIAHSKAILAGTPGATVIEGDLRAPETVLARIADTGLIDFTQPVALLLIAVVHFIHDEEDPWRIVGGLMDALAPGSYLALTHGTEDGKPEVAHAGEKVYQRAVNADLRMRPRADILRLFDGLELLEPGLVTSPEWHPESPADRPEDPGMFWGGLAGVGYKPAELSARLPLEQDIRAVGPRRDRRVGVGVGHHVEERH
jgi:SAM-dependent methyltransferase